MTVAELHEILDNENKKISLKEYKEILFQLKWDVQNEICKLTKEDVTHPKLKWYYGEMNGFQLALDLSEHINEEEMETFEVPDYDNFIFCGNEFIFLNKKGTRKFYMFALGNIHLKEVIDNGYCFKPIKEFINEPKSRESYEKARKMCYDLYLDKEVQDD